MNTIEDFNIEYEHDILGCIFNDPNVIKELVLRPEHFYSNKNRIIYQTMKEFNEIGKDIEFGELVQSLIDKNLIDDVGMDYIRDLSEYNFRTNISQRQKGIVEKFVSREQEKIVTKALSNKLGKSSEQFNSELLDALERLKEQNELDDENDGHISEHLTDFVLWADKDHGDITGAQVGFRDLDMMTNGFQAKELVIVAARPGCGKTAIAINMCQNYSRIGGISQVFSLEMPASGLIKRIISSETNIKGNDMRNPRKNFKDNDWTRAMHSIGELNDSRFFIDDKSNVTTEYIRKKVRNLSKRYNGEHILVVIDYLQLIGGSGKYRNDRQLELADIAKQLKAIAKDYNATVIALSQLSRDNEKRQEKRPMSSDINGSGGIEAAADIIILLHRDDYYDSESENKGIIELIISKHRNGDVGTIKMLFKKETSKFLDIN